MLAIASATPMVAEQFRNPLYGMTWELFFQGGMRLFPLNGIRTYFLNPEVWKDLYPMASFSLGTLLLGLKQPGSLLLLGLLVFAALWPLRPCRAELRALLPESLPHPKSLTLLVAGALLLWLLFPGDVPWSAAEAKIHAAALAADKANVFYSGDLPGLDPRAVRFNQLLLLFTADPERAVLLQSLLFAAVILFSLRRIGAAAGFDWRYPAALLFASPAVRHLCRMPDGTGFRLPLLLLCAALVLPELLRSSGRRRRLWFFAGSALIPLPVLLLAPPENAENLVPDGFRLLGGFQFAASQLPEYHSLLAAAGIVVTLVLVGFALTGIFRLFRRREFDTPRTTLLLSALWIALLLAAAALRFPVSALMVLPALLLVWIGIESTGEPGKRIARGTAGFLLVTTLLLAIRIHAAAGTRDGRHGPTLSCQWEVVQAIRRRGEQVGKLELRDTTGRPPETLRTLLHLAEEGRTTLPPPPEDRRSWVGELSFESDDDPASGWLRVVFSPTEEKTQP